MSFSLSVPRSLRAKTPEELSRKIAEVQIEQNGKVGIVSIYFDSGKKEHVCFYMPLEFTSGGTVGGL